MRQPSRKITERHNAAFSLIHQNPPAASNFEPFCPHLHCFVTYFYHTDCILYFQKLNYQIPRTNFCRSVSNLIQCSAEAAKIIIIISFINRSFKLSVLQTGIILSAEIPKATNQRSSEGIIRISTTTYAMFLRELFLSDVAAISISISSKLSR